MIWRVLKQIQLQTLHDLAISWRHISKGCEVKGVLSPMYIIHIAQAGAPQWVTAQRRGRPEANRILQLGRWNQRWLCSEKQVKKWETAPQRSVVRHVPCMSDASGSIPNMHMTELCSGLPHIKIKSNLKTVGRYTTTSNDANTCIHTSVCMNSSWKASLASLAFLNPADPLLMQGICEAGMRMTHRPDSWCAIFASGLVGEAEWLHAPQLYFKQDYKEQKTARFFLSLGTMHSSSTGNHREFHLKAKK